MGTQQGERIDSETLAGGCVVVGSQVPGCLEVRLAAHAKSEGFIQIGFTSDLP